MKKTNVMRLLDSKNIDYQDIYYKVERKFKSGIEVAKELNLPMDQVYKTLVVEGEKNIYVAVIPVKEEVNFKKYAHLVGEKKIKMLDINKLHQITGYFPGGCSPIDMKKKYITILDEKSLDWEEIVISAGRVGQQIKIERNVLVNEFNFILADICK